MSRASRRQQLIHFPILVICLSRAVLRALLSPAPSSLCFTTGRQSENVMTVDAEKEAQASARGDEKTTVEGRRCAAKGMA